jgi:dipeptide/tripeptide permease
MMGFWFLSDSVGNYVGGTLASFYHSVALPRLFGISAVASVAAGSVMFLFVPSMKKLMGGVN